MKKMLLILALMIIVIHCSYAQKDPIAFGGKGGITISSDPSAFGLNASIFTRFKLYGNFYFQPEVEFDWIPVYDYILYGYQNDRYYNQKLLKVPLVLKYYLRDFYLELGASPGVLLGPDDFGSALVGGMGIDIKDKVCIGLRANSEDMFNYSYSGYFSLSVGLLF